MARIAAISLVTLLLTGCGLPAPPPVISAGSAGKAVGRALGLQLKEVPSPDTPALANVLATLTSPVGSRTALVIVFDSSLATEQATRTDQRYALPGVNIVRVRNVVVLYHGPDAVSRRRRLLSALSAVRSF